MEENLGRAKCRACGEDIFWVKTKNGKLMPMNFNELKQTHFATCPEADKFRKRK